MTRAGAALAPRPEALPRPAARPPLRLVVSRPFVARRLPFFLVLGTLLAGGLVGLLLLHTLAAQDAFALQRLRTQQAALATTEQQLALAEQRRESPAALAAQARALGMVPAGSITGVRRTKQHKVVGIVKQQPVAPAVTAPVTQTKPVARGHRRAAAHPRR